MISFRFCFWFITENFLFFSHIKLTFLSLLLLLTDRISNLDHLLNPLHSLSLSLSHRMIYFMICFALVILIIKLSWKFSNQFFLSSKSSLSTILLNEKMGAACLSFGWKTIHSYIHQNVWITVNIRICQTKPKKSNWQFSHFFLFTLNVFFSVWNNNNNFHFDFGRSFYSSNSKNSPWFIEKVQHFACFHLWFSLVFFSVACWV